MSSQWTRRRTLRLGATLGMVSVTGCLGGSSTDTWDIDEPLPVANAHQFNAPGCSCCEQYASYLRGNLTGDLSETVPADIDAIKREHGIPGEFQSCHTLVLGDYVVEGHVPAGVIATLLEETPAIDGIALPGMPRGSPEMAGEKGGTWTIYVIDGDRSGTEYAVV